MQSSSEKGAVSMALQHPIACLLTALRFLTIFPISWRCEKDGEFFQGGLFYFPVVGGIIGLTGGILYSFIGAFFPNSVISAIMILFLGGCSGFLHYDGLADTCDGFFSSRPRERILEIMRDSRIGAMGVIAIVAIVMLKFAALSSLDYSNMLIALILMPIAGRIAILVSMAVLSYARKEEGLGSLFYSKNCKFAAIYAAMFVVVCCSLVDLKIALLVSLSLVAVIGLFSIWCKQLIGGATGDTLGAICEISEMSVAVGLSCFYL